MHIPVLLNEVIECLDLKLGDNFVDCTIGFGGHSWEIWEKIKPSGKILGIDWDEEITKRIEISDKRLEIGENLILESGNYSNLKDIVEKYNFQPINGILLDLGMSSWGLEQSNRGFSFLKDEPLDMRYSQEQALAAKDIINYWPEGDLENIFKEYGEEKWAKKIAARIVEARQEEKIVTTRQLVKIIDRAIPFRFRERRIHFATRVFQALRIAVNDELNNLKKGLLSAVEILAPGGRVAVISFHSLEDRIAKNFFRDKAKENALKIITKKPITATNEEIISNPRSRSAKLRIAEKIIRS